MTFEELKKYCEEYGFDYNYALEVVEVYRKELNCSEEEAMEEFVDEMIFQATED